MKPNEIIRQVGHHVCLAIALCLAIQSCSKDAKTPAPPPKTQLEINTAFLTAEPWILGGWELKQADSSWVSVPLNDYQKSKKITYNADFTITYQEKSNLGIIQTTRGEPWSLEENGSVLVEGTGANANRLKVLTLNSTTFKELFEDTLSPFTYPTSTSPTYYGIRYIWVHP